MNIIHQQYHATPRAGQGRLLYRLYRQILKLLAHDAYHYPPTFDLSGLASYVSADHTDYEIFMWIVGQHGVGVYPHRYITIWERIMWIETYIPLQGISLAEISRIMLYGGHHTDGEYLSREWHPDHTLRAISIIVDSVSPIHDRILEHQLDAVDQYAVYSTTYQFTHPHLRSQKKIVATRYYTPDVYEHHIDRIPALHDTAYEHDLVCISALSIHRVHADRIKILSVAFRSLRPGGILVLRYHQTDGDDSPSSLATIRLHSRLWRYADHVIARIPPTDRDLTAILVESLRMVFFTEDTIRTELSDIGFTDIAMLSYDKTLANRLQMRYLFAVRPSASF